MPRRADILNVREHLQHVQLVLDGITKYGLCPVIEHELRKLNIMNKAVLRKHQIKRDAGNRHDIYMPR